MAKKKKQPPKKKEGPRYNQAGNQVKGDLSRGLDLAKDYLPKWDDLIQFNPYKNDEYEATLQDLKGRQNTAGQLTDQTKSLIEQYKGAVDYSGDMQDIISRMRSGLEGYAAPELNAMREVQARQNQRNLQTTMRDLTNQGARSGLSGAAGALQKASALNASNRAAQGLEQELFVKNADEKQKRLGDFGGFMTVQEAAKQNRMKDFGSFATGAENDAASRAEKARAEYQAMLDNMRNADLNVTKLNAGQQNTAKAMQSAGTLGMAGLLNSQRQENWLKKFMEENPYSTAPNGMAGGGGGYGPGAAEAFQAMIESFAKASGITVPNKAEEKPLDTNINFRS